ncbi:MAG: AzlD domain-containing protein [Acidobacteriota bacterium]
MSRFELLMLAGMVIVTFSMRYLPMVWVGRRALPKSWEIALEYVPVTVLVALIAPIMVRPEGHVNLRFDNAYLVAGALATLIAWKTRHLLTTILVGMMAFAALRYWLPS